MPATKLSQFGGIAPRIHPTLLGESGAQRAHNCVLKSGKAVPLRAPLKVAGMRIRMENGLSKISDARSLRLWRHGGVSELLAWPGSVRVAGSNLSSDPRSRLFIAGDTGIGGANHPCAYIAALSGNGVTRHDMTKGALPAPNVSAPAAVGDNIRYTVFFQSWVDSYGYESGASLPSTEVSYDDGADVTVAYTAVPAGAVERRIYKVVSGSESERIQFVRSQAASGAVFVNLTFAMRDEDAGEELPMLVSPPEDLYWIDRVPGGFYAGFTRSNLREVRFSESGNPSSWPEAYSASVHDDIVALGVTLNTVFVLTSGSPWAITGTAPDTMSSSVLASPKACVSARSVCVSDGAVFYASSDGVCVLSDGSSSVQVVTDKLFSKREWQALGPDGCMMAAYGGALFCWFEGAREGLVINLRDEAGASVTTHDEAAKAFHYDPTDDALYFVREA